MTILSSTPLPLDSAKMRWQEPYVTAGLNQKVLGQLPKGVFAGFTVIPSGAFGITLQPDPVLGFSGANVVDSTTQKYCVTVLLTENISIDLTSAASSTVYITLDAQYLLGTNSAPQIKVVDEAELSISPNLVLLAKVKVPGVSPVLASHINTGYRLSAGDSLLPEASLPVNLVPNGTFERDYASVQPIGWETYEGIGGSLSPAASTVQARTGTQSMLLNAPTAGTYSVACTPMSVQANQVARASVWIRADDSYPIGDGVGVHVMVVWLDADYSEIGSVQLETVFSGSSTAFEQRQAEVTAPGQAAYAQILFWFEGCSGRLYVDDVEFLVRTPNHLAQSAVFGGSLSVADRYHSHSAAGQSYAGGPAWADGTTNPQTTIEAQLDKIITDLSGASGAPKIGNAPSKILPNIFTQPNTFNDSSPNTRAITAYGNGTGQGVWGSGDSGGSPAISIPGTGVVGVGRASTSSAGVVGLSSLNGSGVIGMRTGTGASILGVPDGVALPTLAGEGVYGLGSGSSTGVKGEGGPTNGVGVLGQGHSGGAGGWFLSDTTAGSGSWALIGQGGSGSGAGGVWGIGRGGSPGVEGDGGDTNADGVYGVGGGTTGVGVRGTSTDFHGVYGYSNGNGAGVYGESAASNGVYGLGAAGASGVYGEMTAATGYGVAGRATTTGAVAMLADATGGGLGLQVNSTGAGKGIDVSTVGARAINAANTHNTEPTGYFSNSGNGAALVGRGNGAAAGIGPGVGVFGQGRAGQPGGWFVGNGAGGLALEIVAGTGNAVGIEVFGSGTEPAIDLYNSGSDQTQVLLRTQGHIALNSVQANGNRAFTRTLTPNNIPKAIVQIQLNNTATPTPTAATLATNTSAAFNIASVAQNLGTAVTTVTWATPFASATDYIVMAFLENNFGGTPRVATVLTGSKTAGAYSFTIYDGITGVGLTAAQESGLLINLVAYGRQ